MVQSRIYNLFRFMQRMSSIFCFTAYVRRIHFLYFILRTRHNFYFSITIFLASGLRLSMEFLKVSCLMISMLRFLMLPVSVVVMLSKFLVD